MSRATRQPTISIGIPAFNEAANIKQLVVSLLRQKQSGFTVTEIIVASDGSTDQTVSILKRLNEPKVVILDNKDRKGQAARQNQILKKVSSDVLVLINADVVIDDPNFLASIAEPILTANADLVSTSISTVPSETFVGQTLNYSLEMKNRAFESYQHGQNIYTCHGAARAFSRKLYRHFEFQASVGEDAYSYLYCVINDYKYVFTSRTVVKIKSPVTIKDHQHQSVRFFQTDRKLKQYFATNVLQKAYHLPLQFMIASYSKFLWTHPLHAGAYGLIVMFMKLQSYRLDLTSNTWAIAHSSKNKLTPTI